MEYMVFDNLTTANGAKQAIEIIGGLPLIGVRASDNIEQPDKCKTETWDSIKQRKDGKYVMQRLPIEFRQKYADNESVFDSNFPHVIENYSETWFDEQETA